MFEPRAKPQMVKCSTHSQTEEEDDVEQEEDAVEQEEVDSAKDEAD